MIIGVDFHPEFQQIASVDTDTRELQEERLAHREGVEKFYRELATQGMKVEYLKIGACHEHSGHKALRRPIWRRLSSNETGVSEYCIATTRKETT